MRLLSAGLICFLWCQAPAHCQDFGSKLLNQAKQVGSKQATQLLKSVSTSPGAANASAPPAATVGAAATTAAPTATTAAGAAVAPPSSAEKPNLTDKAKGLLESNAMKYGKKYSGQYLGKGKGELNKLLDKTNLK